MPAERVFETDPIMVTTSLEVLKDVVIGEMQAMLEWHLEHLPAADDSQEVRERREILKDEVIELARFLKEGLGNHDRMVRGI
jgi:hypothetical protein